MTGLTISLYFSEWPSAGLLRRQSINLLQGARTTDCTAFSY